MNSRQPLGHVSAFAVLRQTLSWLPLAAVFSAGAGIVSTVWMPPEAVGVRWYIVLLVFLYFCFVAWSTGKRLHAERIRIGRLVHSLADGVFLPLDADNRSGNPALNDSFTLLRRFMHHFVEKIDHLVERLEKAEAALVSLSETLNAHSMARRQRGDDMIVCLRRIMRLCDALEKQLARSEKELVDVLAMEKQVDAICHDIDDAFARFSGHSMSLRAAHVDAESALKQISLKFNRLRRFKGFASSAVLLLHDHYERLAALSSALSEQQGLTMEALTGVQGLLEQCKQTLPAVTGVLDRARGNLAVIADQAKGIQAANETVAKLSEQTALLALNAGILASDTNGVSRGFRVIAAEVRALAETIGLSTQEIGKISAQLLEGLTLGQGKLQQSRALIAQADKQQLEIADMMESLVLLERNCRDNVRTMGVLAEKQNTLQQELLPQTQSIERRIIAESRTLRDTDSHVTQLGHALAHFDQHLRSGKERINSQYQTAGEAFSGLRSMLESHRDLGTMNTRLLRRLADAQENLHAMRQKELEKGLHMRTITLNRYGISNEAQKLSLWCRSARTPLQRKGGELVVNMQSIDSSRPIDPVNAPFIHYLALHHALFETLVRFSSGFELELLLCERYEVLEQGRVFRFYLKQDVIFHNGKRLHAEDVKYSFERLKYCADYLTASPQQYIGPIQGFADFMADKAYGLEGLRVLSPACIEIVLQEPCAYFLKLLSQVEMSILPRSAYPMLQQQPCGTGPFILHRASQHGIELHRYARYHQKGFPYLDKVRFVYNRPFKDMLHGDFHLYHSITMKDKAAVRMMHGGSPVIFEPVDSFACQYVAVNSALPGLDNQQVRKALMLSIDRHAFARTLYHGRHRIAESIIPPGLFAHHPRKDLVRYNPSEAKELLRKSGCYPLQLDYYHSSGLSAELRFVFAAFASIGVNVRTIRVQPAERKQRQHQQPFRLLNLVGDYPDPDCLMYPVFHSQSIEQMGFALGRPAPGFDSVLEKSRTESDDEKRKKLYHQAEEFLLDQAVVLPLSFPRHFLALRSEVVCQVRSLPPNYSLRTCWLQQ